MSSRSPRVGVATCTYAPELDEDGPRLLELLAQAGLECAVGAWDDPAVDWGSFDVVLVRSTWDYTLRRSEFLAWTRTCRRVLNPADVLAWNTDKAYLADLATAGVPTVPSAFLVPGAAFRPPPGDYVVKPSVSASAADTGRFDSSTHRQGRELVDRLHRDGRTAMVQPYLPGIEAAGETSLVYLGGAFSHAVTRPPLLLDTGVRTPVVVADVLSTVVPAMPSGSQLDVAQAALDAVPGGGHRLAYARVDLIPGHDGPVLLELEATECFLFLSFASEAALGRLARAVTSASDRPTAPR